MPRFLPDTSCMLAALCAWHEHHDPAEREINGRLAEGQIMVVAGPALVELYSVLTRLPQPYRRPPAACLIQIAESFLGDSTALVALSADAYRRLLFAASEGEAAGGAIYDAVIMACAGAAQVDSLLTFNARQFQRIESDGIQVVVPR